MSQEAEEIRKRERKMEMENTIRFDRWVKIGTICITCFFVGFGYLYKCGYIRCVPSREPDMVIRIEH